MKRTLVATIAFVGAVAGAPGKALAQAPGIDPEDAVAPIAIVEGAGVKVGEGTVLHPSIGIEAGVVSNVFYENQGSVASGLIRILGEIGAGSLSSQRLAPTEQQETTTPSLQDIGDFQYRTDLRLAYDYFPTTDDRIRSQGGLGAGFLFRGVINPQRPWQGAVYEDFQRLIRPTNFESSDGTNRDINDLKLQLQFAPLGRNLSGLLHYENVIDVFERDSQQFANRFQNTVGLRLNYQWLPQTRTYLDFSQGIYTGLGNSTKVTSYPLTATFGIQTLLTPATTFVSRIGYTNGFYTSGPSYSALVFGAQFGYRYSPLGHVAILYNYLHNDSINANFYRDHQIQANIEHGFAPFDVIVQAGLDFREYDGVTLVPGPTVRDDVLGTVMAEVRYNFRDWLAASANYQLLIDSTDYMYTTDGVTLNPGYVRHELMAGIRAAY